MKVLGIDSSSAVISVAVVEDKKLLCEFTVNNKMTHSQTLMPLISEMMKSIECEISDIDLFAVAKGPGSFTGLRIGIETAKALAHAAGKEVVGVGTLEGLAYNLPYCEHLIVPIMDARRNQVYTGTYMWDTDGFKEIEEPCAESIDECLADCGNFSEIVFLGDGVPVYHDYIVSKMGDKAIFVPPTCNLQRAGSIATLAFLHLDEKEKYTDLAPLYLRKSQAEREYEEKNKGIANN